MGGGGKWENMGGEIVLLLHKNESINCFSSDNLERAIHQN